MPLPFAPPPKDSKLYQQLESTTLQTVTADQLDTIRAKTFSQGTEGTEDEYRRMMLLGQVSNQISTSGPIPGTSKIVEITYSANEYYTIIEPSAGEVWQVIGMFAFTATGFTSGNVSVADTVNSTRCHIADVSSSGGDVFDQGWEGPVYLDENTKLQFYPNGTLSSSASVNTFLIRVR